MFHATPDHFTPSAWARYTIALGLVILATVTRIAFTPTIGPTALPFITYFPAVALAAWFGQVGPGVLCLALSVGAADWFFMEPFHSWRIASGFNVVALIVFALASGIIIAAIQLMHVARFRIAGAVEERQRAQAALAVTLSSIGDGVIATDNVGRVTFLNPEAERLTGWTEADAKGKPLPEIFRIFNERTREPTANPVEKALRSGRAVGLANHTILKAKTGLETPIDDSAAPIRQRDGTIAGVVLVFRDVTEERSAQAAKARLAAIVEHSGDVILSKDLNGIIQTWNASAQRLFGYTAEEIVGRSVTMLIPPERLHEEAFILDRLRHGKPVEHLETVRVAKDGTLIPIALSVSPIRADDGTLIGASKVIHNISDLVAAREALVREKELLETTLASIGDAVIVTDVQGNVTFLNAEAERLTGWTRAEASRHPLPQVFRIVNEQTRASVENPVDKVIRQGGSVGLANHTVLVRRDGTETPIDDSAAPIREPGGPMFGVVLVFRDATHDRRSQALLQEAHEQLRSRAVNLESLVQQRTARLNEMITDLEAFSYSIVHDMRAPLRAMQGFAQLLGEECGPISPTAADYVRRIMNGASRLDRLIQDGLSYSRMMRADLPLTTIDLAALIRGIVDTYPAFHAPAARIEIEGPFPLVLGNEAALTPCVSNLLDNAVKFVAPGIIPHVRIWTEPRPDRVRVFFKDNGIGISAQAHEKIFDIFYRHDPKFAGTGIGLAIVKKAAERMGGKAGVESAPGQGSTFWVDLPQANGAARATSLAN